MMLRVVCAGLALVTLLSAGAASADEPTPATATATDAGPPPPPAPTEAYWYGGQTLAVDGISAAAVLGAVVLPPLAIAGAGGLVLGAPIVHLVNDRPGAAVVSLALRTALPIGAGVIGYNLAGSCNRNAATESGSFLGPCFLHGWNEAAIGGLVGMGVAIATDATLLARGTRPVTPPADSVAPRVTSLAPSFDPKTRTTSVGVAGTF